MQGIFIGHENEHRRVYGRLMISRVAIMPCRERAGEIRHRLSRTPADAAGTPETELELYLSVGTS